VKYPAGALYERLVVFTLVLGLLFCWICSSFSWLGSVIISPRFRVLLHCGIRCQPIK